VQTKHQGNNSNAEYVEAAKWLKGLRK
jgi:hypothetical protein